MTEREFMGPTGVTIPLSTIVAGGKTGVLKHLSDGLAEATSEIEAADAHLTAKRDELEQAELRFARAEASADAWGTAYKAAKRAFGDP